MTRKDAIKKKTAEMAWAIVSEKEGELEAVQNALREQEAKLVKCERVINQKKEERAQLKAEKEEVQQKIQAIADTNAKNAKTLENLKRLWQKKRSDQQTAERPLREIKAKVEALGGRAEYLYYNKGL